MRNIMVTYGINFKTCVYCEELLCVKRLVWKLESFKDVSYRIFCCWRFMKCKSLRGWPHESHYTKWVTNCDQLDTHFQGPRLIVPGISIRRADSSVIPEKVAAVWAHNEHGMRRLMEEGAPAFALTWSRSWRMEMVSEAHKRELTSAVEWWWSGR